MSAAKTSAKVPTAAPRHATEEPDPARHGRTLLAALALALGVALTLGAPAGAFDFTYAGTTRVSVSSTGTEANAGSGELDISADRGHVAFESNASNLVAGDANGWQDVFVRDLASGETTRVSVSTTGADGNESSFHPAPSADGRYVAFDSNASNLVTGDTNGRQDVFVRDLASGETTCVSVSSTGAAANDSSSRPAVSSDSRYVAFYSHASNLVASDTNSADDVFVRDLATGETTRVSMSSAGVEGNGASEAPAVSADGRYVAFASLASNLVASDANGYGDIFVRDLATGETTRASVSSAGAEGNGRSYASAVSSDGRYVAFTSDATNLVASDVNGVMDVFVRDLVSGETTRVSVSSTGAEGDGLSEQPAISSNGRYVAFSSEATNLVTGDTNGVEDVFVRDLVSGETSRVSVSSTGAEGDDGGWRPALSSDGRYVAFNSNSTNLVTGDTNGVGDVFVRAPLPSTDLTAAPPLPDGLNGWYVAAPQVVLSCDETMATTYYRWDSGSWSTYATTLTAAEGSHTLEYFSAIASLDLTETVQSAIFRLDSQDPTGTMALSHGASLTSVRTISVDTTVTDAGSGPDKMRVGFEGGPNFPASWITYTPSAVATLTTGDGTKTVYAEVKDAAGRVTQLSDTIRYVRPRATVYRPTVSPLLPRRYGLTTLSGVIAPRVAGKSKLYIFRWAGGGYVRWKGPIYVSNYYISGQNRSKWTYRFRPPYRGKWYCYYIWGGDTNTTANTSARKYFTVR